MRKQRFAYTLPTQDDFIIPPEQDDARSIFQSEFSLQDPVWSQMFSAPELDPIVPCYLYQYPVIQIPPGQFQSVSSILSSPSFQFNPYENLEAFGQMPTEMGNAANSPPNSNSGYGDCIIPKMFTHYEPQVPYDPFYGSLPQELTSQYPMVTNYGTVVVFLRHLIRADFAADKSVFLTNLPAECVSMVNAKGDRSAVIHPNGRVFHDMHDIHMTTLDKKAKISRRGIVFTSRQHCLSFLVDASGTKTTSEKFRDLSSDFSHLVFKGDSSDGSLSKCRKMAEEAVHKTFKNGDEVWMVGGIRIKQDQWGDVKLSRHCGRVVSKASPTTGRMCVSTLDVDITVGRYHNNYLTVRKGNQSVTASLRGFDVQSGTQKAGFNRTGKLVIK